MDVDDELLSQWEPKIQKILGNIWISGFEREDIAQELRIVVIKAARAFDETRGVLFHTYLHTSMVNTLRTLLAKAHKQIDTKSLDFTYEETDLLPLDIVKALTDKNDFTLDFDVADEVFFLWVNFSRTRIFSASFRRINYGRNNRRFRRTSL